MMQRILLIASLILFAGGSFSQDSTRTFFKQKNRKVSILPSPSFAYSPETSLAIGVVALFTVDLYQDSITRPSAIRMSANYSLRKQAVTELRWNYFTREESWLTRGYLHYSKFVDYYYGWGHQSPESNEFTYETNRFILDVDGLKSVYPKVFLGLGFRYLNYSNFVFFGEPNPYSELTQTDVWSVKLNAINDTRNNLVTATEGSYRELNVIFNWANNFYTKVNLDFREFFTWKKNVFAARFFNTFNFGQAAFYDAALIGSDLFARGYYFGRYRGNHMSTLQFEYRTPRLWRFGLAAFGGFSTVYNKVNYLKWMDVKPNVGIGLRALFDKKNNTSLRLDYAIGADGQSGFYVRFGESF